MKVLFPTDGSEASIYAIKKTLSLLRPDCEVDVINIIDWGIFPTYITFPAETETAFPSQKNEAQNIVDSAKLYIENLGYKVTTADFIYGKPDKIILDLIEEKKYELIAMGSHGKKGIAKWLGSLSRKIVTKSPIPTLIARPPNKKEEITGRIKEILIPVDGSMYSYNAIKTAMKLFDLQNSNIEIVTVKSGEEGLPVEIVSDKEWLRNCLQKQEEIAIEILENSRKILEDCNLKPKNIFSLTGDAAHEILKYENINKKDLIILGSHGREGISDILLGSVSKRVLEHSQAPVLIVPVKK
jgi:nucleotide-binding universal stress UspA family protein